MRLYLLLLPLIHSYILRQTGSLNLMFNRLDEISRSVSALENQRNQILDEVRQKVPKLTKQEQEVVNNLLNELFVDTDDYLTSEKNR